MSEPAFIVDRQGLAKKLANRPKAFILYELLQNAWDEDATEVKVTAHMKPGRPVCQITVEDDSPEGFQDLTSVYTLFKDSKKAPDPTKRGRFEMGEKLVIALATYAEVCSTKGTVIFEKGKRRHIPAKTQKGTIFEGEFNMSREVFAELCVAMQNIAVPERIKTFFNGVLLQPRVVLHTFETTLQTVKSDGDGSLTPTQRKTLVRVYEPREFERGHIYEMGIPVVETDDQWHYDVQQRVPVNWERDNVPPAYLRTLRVEVLNAMHDRMPSGHTTTAPWVTDALNDVRCSPEAVRAVVTKRFGEKVVINDPSDPEGTKIAMSQGYEVIPGGAFSKAAWDNVRAAKAALPAGQVTPSPKPYDPNGNPEKVIERSEWTPDMHRIAEFASDLFCKLVADDCFVVIVDEPNAPWLANFGPTPLALGSRLCLNYGRLGKVWFERPKRSVQVLGLLLHEYIHHTVSDHLSHEMHETATELGAKLTNLALDEPEFFNE